MKKRRKLNVQKTFCTISASFIIACILFYGFRFVTLYLDNKKSLEAQADTLAKVITDNNKNDDTFKDINGDYYFSGKVDDNYVMYSNMLWRVVKVNKDNSIKLVSSDNISYLAFDDEITSFNDSYISKWLNTDVLTNQLDKNAITYNPICTDNITETNNKECENYNNELNFGLLSVAEYVNAGGEESYLNNEKFFYLSSIKDDEVWYVTSRGKLKSSSGDKLYGVRPTITLKANTIYTSGKGTSEDPYQVSSDTLFASFVELGDETWRVYEVNGDTIKLSLNDYLKVDNTEFSHIYSNDNYYHNDTTYGSLAFYLNQTYINDLSYQNNLLETNWSNGLLSSNYDYKDCLDTTVNSKIAMLSIGNIILNDNLNNYFLMSGNSENEDIVYEIKENGSMSEISVSSEAYVVPTIAISKDLLTKGKGTSNEPYEVE